MSQKCGECLRVQEAVLSRGQSLPESHPGFVAKGQRYDCGQCMRWHAEKYRYPALEPDDYAPWNLYLNIQGQQRSGMEPIALDIGVLPVVFHFEGIPEAEHRLRYRQLAVLDRAFHAYYREKRERDAETRAAQAKMKGKRG